MPANGFKQDGVDAARAVLMARGDLAHTPADFRTALLALAELREFAAGEDMIRADATDGHIFGLVRGAAAMTTVLGPTDTRVNHMLHPGDWFGHVQLFTGERRNGTIQARSDCLVVRIPRPALDRLLDANPGWWRHIGALAARYGNIATGIVADLMIADSRRRCLAMVLRMAGCRFETPAWHPVEALVSQDELGAVANLGRNTVNAILRDAQARGLLAQGYHRITVLAPDALRAIVDEL